MSSRKHSNVTLPPPKKKFGKNLHSAHVAASSTAAASVVGRALPPPPIASFHPYSSSSISSSKITKRETIVQSSTTGGGGLLLLSTKKSANSAVNSSNNKNGAGGGNYGSGGNGYMTVSSSSSSSTKTKIVKGNSTHDALVNALNGGDRQDAVQEKIPSAWGIQAPISTVAVANGGSEEKVHRVQNNVDHNDEPIVANVGGMEKEKSQNCRAHEDKNVGGEDEDKNVGGEDRLVEESNNEKNDDMLRKNETEHPVQDEIPTQRPPRSHENAVTAIDTESEGAIMTGSTAPTAESNTATVSTSYSATEDGNFDQFSSPRHEGFSENQVEFMKKLAKERAEKRRQEEKERETLLKERAMQRLHELDMKLKLEKERSQKHQQQQPVEEEQCHQQSVSSKSHLNPSTDGTTHVAPVRQLYDPKKSYSSLLGGGQATSKDIPIHSSASTTVPAPASLTPAISISPQITQPPTPENLIHLNSYEDQNRGIRNSDAGPRMLFDPKSGSMVAAPTLPKEKKATKKNAPRKNSKDVTDDPSLLKISAKKENNLYGKSVRQSEKIRQHASKRNLKDLDDKKLAPKSESSSLKSQRVLPRTCGVLYKYNENGEIVSADGCDGDRGYGAHSVPGGRIKNPKAYAVIKQKELESSRHHSKHPRVKHSIDATSNEQNYGQGLTRSHFMRKTSHQPSNSTGSDIPSSIVDVLRGDEKLDLLSNLEASPKLQATAAAWAPSQAVLALTATNATHVSREAISTDHDGDMESCDQISESGVHAMNAIALIDTDSVHDILDHGEPSPSIDLGLGFDPSKNMDSLMMSPATGAETPSNIDLADLKLRESPSQTRPTSNPFIASNSILGSSTWGTGGNNSSTMGSLSNWDLLSSKSSSQRVNLHRDDAPKTFLSLGVSGDQATWSNSHGTPFGGFNSIDTPSVGSSD